MRYKTISIDVVKIEDEGFHLLIKGSINDLPAIFIIDTGASRTVLDTNQLSKYNITEDLIPNEMLSTGVGESNLDSFLIKQVDIRLRRFVLATKEVTLISLKHVNDAYKRLGLPKVAGIIGSDLLIRHQAIIDFNQAKLKLKP
ncbi:MAG: aspartyl protease family protein [Flavobacteriales bacterium]|nr:aspartyl protease family protein [Flavobacteriales bacterium]